MFIDLSGYHPRTSSRLVLCFFFQAEDGIRDYKVTGVQTCALPICDGVPVVAVPTEHTPDAWWAMAAHGIKGVLAVGVPPDLLEELSQKAFPLGVYGLDRKSVV